MKEEIKYLKHGVHSCKCQVAAQLWRDNRDVKLISTLHTAKMVETEKKNRKAEN
jgi:hypothetical protein